MDKKKDKQDKEDSYGQGLHRNTLPMQQIFTSYTSTTTKWQLDVEDFRLKWCIDGLTGKINSSGSCAS
jgi:hypothetical protein